MEPLPLVLGALLVVLVLWDLFQTVVVPRPTPGRFRMARYVLRESWTLVKWVGRRSPTRLRDTLFGLFGPGSAIALLGVWLASLILGYGLMLYALRDQLRPVPENLGTAVYFAASSVLTLGYGDVIAEGTAARVLVILAAAAGLGAVALVVTFLFSLYGSYQRRELRVVALEAATGAPPSAVALLETYAGLDLLPRLPIVFAGWEGWAAEVLDSHVAYPILCFFRSSHDNLSWISSLGTVLDTASLVVTTIDGLPAGEAELARRVGAHLVEDISNLGFREGSATVLDREAFEAACDRLAAVGLQLRPRDQAWIDFQVARQPYAERLELMATYFATPASSWLGMSEGLRSPAHVDEPAVRRPATP